MSYLASLADYATEQLCSEKKKHQATRLTSEKLLLKAGACDIKTQFTAS